MDHDLLATILERPDDNELRIVYADYLEERGDLPRATRIRTECELAGVPKYDARWIRHWGWGADQQAALALPELPDGMRWSPFATERGLPCRLVVSDIEAFLRHAFEVFEKAPITRLELAAADGGFPIARLLALPMIDRIRSLRFTLGRFAADTVRVLDESRRLPQLVDLRFDFAGIAGDGLRQLLRSPLAQRLSRLGLRNSFHLEHGLPIRDAFAAAPALPALRRLDLAHNRLDAGVLRPVLERVPALEALLLYENPLGDDGYRLLAGSPHLTRLTSLDINHTYPRRAGIRALAASARLASLRSLSLRNNRLGPTAAPLLAAAPWGELRFLDLHGNRLGDAGVSAVVRSPALRRLERADVRDNGLGPQTAALAKRWFWDARATSP